MKSFAKKFASTLIDQCGRVVRIIRFRDGVRKQRVIVLAPSWEGSIGDEAVIKASTDYLAGELGYTVDLLTFNAGKPYQQAKSISEHINIPQYFKTGGWRDRIRLIGILAKYDRFVLLGTDSLDGHYTEWQSNGLMTLACQAANSGLPTTVAGISMQASPKESCIQNLSRIGKSRHSKVFVRDEISMGRIVDIVPNIRLTADPAFLLNVDLNSLDAPRVSDWIDSRRSCGDLVIGMNISNHNVPDSGNGTVAMLEDSLVDALLELSSILQQALSVIVIPHDFKTGGEEMAICHSLSRKLNSVSVISTTMYEPPVTAASVKGLVGKMDYVFSGRMHLAIAALGAGVPVGCVTYQGKFEGLFRHFGLDGLTITPEEALNSSKLAAFLERGILGRAALAAAIAERLPSVRQLARENFQ